MDFTDLGPAMAQSSQDDRIARIERRLDKLDALLLAMGNSVTANHDFIKATFEALIALKAMVVDEKGGVS